MKKAGAKNALQFFNDNFIMIASLEAKGEEGCAEKCLKMLEKYVKENCKSNEESEVRK